MITNSLKALSIAIAIFILATPAMSAPVTWIINGTFADGGTAQGALVYDADTGVLSDWNIQVDGGDTTTFPTFTYNPTSTTNMYMMDPLHIAFVGPYVGPYSNSYRHLRFTFPVELTNAGGMVNLIYDGQGSLECNNCIPSRILTGFLATDMDEDGYTYDVDCDDSNSYVNPGAHELPGDVVDDNCDGSLGECDPNAEWKNHGQFVRCVAHETDQLIEMGVLSQEEGDELISTAAQTDIGKK